MLGERGSIFKKDFRDLPIDLLNQEHNYNTLWGKRYFVFLNDGDNDCDFDMMVDKMLVMRYLG